MTEKVAPQRLDMFELGLKADAFLVEIREMIREDVRFQVEVRGVDPKVAYRETQQVMKRFASDLTDALMYEVVSAERYRRKSVR